MSGVCLLINRLIDSLEGRTQEQFVVEFNEWLFEKGYTSLSEQTIVLPKLAAPVKVGSGTAVFHQDYTPNSDNLETYRRYFLVRTWDADLPIMALFGMNPSNAGSCSNDNTVEFMMKVAKQNGYGSLYVVNMSPYIKSAKTSA